MGKKNPRHNWTETNFKGLEFKRTREWKEHLDRVFEEKGVFKNVKYSTLSEHDEKRRSRAKREFFKKKKLAGMPQLIHGQSGNEGSSISQTMG
jgi:hypothetical protein